MIDKKKIEEMAQAMADLLNQEQVEPQIADIAKILKGFCCLISGKPTKGECYICKQSHTSCYHYAEQIYNAGYRKVLTIEELKKEANKLGYNLTKKITYEKLEPCVCGEKRRIYQEISLTPKGKYYYCSKCGLKGDSANSWYKARENWNRKVTQGGTNGNKTE